MHEKPKPDGLRRWLTTVDHADVGRLYVAFGVLAGLWGATDAMALRTELLGPGRTVWGPETYAAFFTTHGLTMLFFFAGPVFFGLANVLVPPLVGADDVAFPRLNAVAFWLLPPALLFVRSGIVAQLLGLPGFAPPTTGWTLNPPLSAYQSNRTVDLLLLGLHLSGVSTVATAVNLVVTVLHERTVPWSRVDVFTWSVLSASGLALFAFPVLGSALLMLVLDRSFGTAFFAVDGGGPLLWQHLFWFFGHPEVYILALPAMGVVSYLLPTFAGRRLFGFRSVVYSTLAIGVLAFGVWAHHMFTTGLDPRIRASFMAVSLAIAVPSAVKTFNWMATLWNGRIRTTPPMLCCLFAVAFFVVGGVTGVFLASIPVDLVLHGTYYVVAHFHLVLVGTVVFAAFGAGYHWFPLLTGRLYDRRLARTHVLLTALGVLLTFAPLLFVGMAGLPRRMATYPAEFALLQGVSTLGAYLLGFAQLLWLVVVGHALRDGPRVDPDDADVWGLARDGCLPREWAWFAERLDAQDDGER